jgi:hypothetical protein
MESSARDAEKLNYMTQIIQSDATQSAEEAKEISKIDEELSEIVRDMISSLNGGKNAISNEDLHTNLSKAKEAHSHWMKDLKRIVDEMKIYPIQTNSRKCAFGHFYHSINVTHSDLASEWLGIDKVHDEFHNLGMKVIKAINSNDSVQANTLYIQAEKQSQELIALIDNVIKTIEKSSASGIEILKVAES